MTDKLPLMQDSNCIRGNCFSAAFQFLQGFLLVSLESRGKYTLFLILLRIVFSPKKKYDFID